VGLVSGRGWGSWLLFLAKWRRAAANCQEVWGLHWMLDKLAREGHRNVGTLESVRVGKVAGRGLAIDAGF